MTIASTPEREFIAEDGELMTVRRPEDSAIASGRGGQILGAPYQITAVWQPAKTRKVEHMFQGMRGRDLWAIWSLEEIRLNDEIDDPDNGDIYALQEVEFWKKGGFWRGITMRRGYSVNPDVSRAG